MLGKYISNVRNAMPMIHCITNHVMMKDVANMILACGGSPMMSSELAEIEDITSFCDGFCVNVGMPSEKTMEAIIRAGKQSNHLKHVVVLEPDITDLDAENLENIIKILKEMSLDALCGNLSEIQLIAEKFGLLTEGKTFSADITEDNLERVVTFLNQFAKKINGILVVFGENSFVSNGTICYIIKNGTEEMKQIQRMECLLSVLVTAFLIANPEQKQEAAVAAVCTLGCAGEIAIERIKEEEQPQYKEKIINAVYQMQEPVLDEKEQYSIK